MTDVELVRRKLAHLVEHLARLKRRRAGTAEAFASDVDLQDALAMSLLVVLQEATDVAFHVAADEHWGVPRTARDGFDKLAAHGLIPLDLAERLGRIASLRNRVAHGYATVEPRRLWDEIPDGIAAFDEFVARVGDALRGG